MKKVFTVLAIMMVLASAVFAAPGDKLVLTSEVQKLPPVFQIKSGTTIGSSTGVEVDTQKDIAEEDITWSFDVWQKSNTVDTTKAYARYNKPVTLTLTLGNFTYTDTTNNVTYTEAGTPSVESVSLGTVPANGKLALAKTQDAKGAVVTYTGKVADQLMATFNCKWPSDETLPDGTYKANVTLVYEVQ